MLYGPNGEQLPSVLDRETKQPPPEVVKRSIRALSDDTITLMLKSPVDDLRNMALAERQRRHDLRVANRSIVMDLIKHGYPNAQRNRVQCHVVSPPFGQRYQPA